MKSILELGANGQIARRVIEALANQHDRNMNATSLQRKSS
jgi:hypothetical protein